MQQSCSAEDDRCFHVKTEVAEKMTTTVKKEMEKTTVTTQPTFRNTLQIFSENYVEHRLSPNYVCETGDGCGSLSNAV